MIIHVKFDPLAILGLMKILNSLDFARGVYKSLEIMINSLYFFEKYLKIYEESMVLIFVHITILTFLTRLTVRILKVGPIR